MVIIMAIIFFRIRLDFCVMYMLFSVFTKIPGTKTNPADIYSAKIIENNI